MRAIELSDLSYSEESTYHNPVKTEKKPSLKEIVLFTPPIISDSIVEKEIEELQEIYIDSVSLSDSIELISLLTKTFTQEETGLLLREKQEASLTDENNKDAEFPGGNSAFIRYIFQNIQYPSVAIKQRIQGRVVCSFIIHQDGSISDITLIQGVYIFLDEEALRVLHSMPPWKPAIQNGKPVKSKCIVPIVFKL
jgi:TonB family protein